MLCLIETKEEFFKSCKRQKIGKKKAQKLWDDFKVWDKKLKQYVVINCC